MFSGSYDSEDVSFLLKPVRLAFTEVAEKERLIQSGRRHYSEMISRESLPSPAYLRVFHEGLAIEKARFARDLIVLARHLASNRAGALTIVSLARAGTPIGVLVARILRRLGKSVTHYSISIIRDRGLDETALAYVLGRHPADSLVFVDGWTGKGVIAHELRRAIDRFNARNGRSLDSGLYVVSDLCGAAAFAASAADYLIPSSVLGATISGLVSRSILNDEVVGPGDFHGCVYYEEFAAADLSRWFVGEMDQEIQRQWESSLLDAHGVSPEERLHSRHASDNFLADLRRRFGMRNLQHIKPGIGEATRVLLRRVPDCILIRDPSLASVAHLLLLARDKQVPIIVEESLPYHAAALIKELD